MKLIVGLGNPGKEYEETRHNIGFKVIDFLITNAKFLSLRQGFGRQANSNIHFDKIFNAEIAKGKIGEEDVVLVKPQTFMNESGVAVHKLIKNYKLKITNDLIVVQDDLTIELGKIKISVGANAGNHNGVQSVIDHVGTNEFVRVRLGIGRGQGEIKDVVLSKFKSEEMKVINDSVKKASEACILIITDDVNKASNNFN